MSVSSEYDALAARYLSPWVASGITRQLVDDAHERWGDYRDAGMGGFTPLGEARSPNCRILILKGRLYYVPCVGRRSRRRLARHRATMDLMAATLEKHELPDLFRGAPATAHAIGAEPDAANLIRHYPAVAARLRALLAAHLGVPVSHVGPSLRTSRPPSSQGGSASRP